MLDQLMAAAEASLEQYKFYGCAAIDRFQVHIVPVTQRTRAMKAHYRVTYYLKNQYGAWKRTNRAKFMAEIGADVCNADIGGEGSSKKCGAVVKRLGNRYSCANGHNWDASDHGEMVG